MSTIDQFRICSSEEIRKKKQEQQNRYEDQEVQSWSKGYELMAIISAGSFAVIASLSQEEPTWVLKTAMILMLLTVVSVVVGFHSHSRYLRLLKRENPISKQVFLASRIVSLLRTFSLYTFLFSNLALLLSVIL